MQIADYEKHLIGQLCWDCHKTTHKSSERQRQCPECKHKWSFHQKQIEWKLLEAFCYGLSAHQASKDLDVSYRTAYQHFMSFRKKVEAIAQNERISFLKHIQSEDLPLVCRHKHLKNSPCSCEIVIFSEPKKEQIFTLIIPKNQQTLIHDKAQMFFKKGLALKLEPKELSFRSEKELNQWVDLHPQIKKFIHFAKRFYLKAHGVDFKNFYLYLQEYEFRYNHRHDRLLSLIFDSLLTKAS